MRTRRLLTLALALAALALTSPAAAQQSAGEPGDYDPESGDWNGMRDFFRLAEAEQVELVMHEELDYDALALEEPVLIVYPQQPLRADSLSRYVVDGGHVMLVDDFGASTSFLERLDISRVEPLQGALPHDVFLDNNPALPVVRARGVHPLIEGVDIVVANHPAVLYNIGGPVLSYSADGGLVYDMNLGEGKVIVVGDASLVINHMLLLADNGQFWRNALDYLCEDASPCRVHLVVGAFGQRGSYGSSDDLFGDREEILEDVTAFNEALAEMMKQLPAEKLFYYLSILLSIGLALYLFTIFPLRRTRPYSAYMSDTLDNVHPPQSEFDWNLSRFAHGAKSMNYALPVSILKEIFEHLFLEALGLWEVDDEEERPKIPALGRIFRERYLDVVSPEDADRIERQVVDLLATFATVPTRHRVFLDSDTYFSERDLLKIHERSLEILDIMGLKEAYERRTRSDI